MADGRDHSMTPFDQATRMLAQRNLHQRIWISETSGHERLRVTFSTTSNFGDKSLPTILFIGPMFGTRYLGLAFDKPACEIGVRVMCVDRPALGGSMPVNGEHRLSVWLETVPLLLEHLAVKHVSIMSHSAGTIYTLNTLSRLRSILDPKMPYVAMLGPWVDQACSNVGLMNAVSKLPSGAFSYWSNLTSFINQSVMPASSWSGGVISSMTEMFQGHPGAASTTEDSDEDAQEKYGVDKQTMDEIDKQTTKYAFSEDMSGANDEARLCVKKLGPGSWGDCEDYMAFVRTFAGTERNRINADGAAVKLKVRLHFAESDMMIGKEGQKYFEQCWRQEGVADAVDVDSKEWPRSNHETVLLDLKKGAVQTVFEDIKRLHAQATGVQA